jgi:hypothetical protein
MLRTCCLWLVSYRRIGSNMLNKLRVGHMGGLVRQPTANISLLFKQMCD